jgi:hypothetical protein
MTMEFREIFGKAKFGKKTRNLRSQSSARSFVRRDRAAENVPNFLLHAMAVVFSPALQAHFHRIFDVPDHQLCHESPLQDLI